MATLGLFKTLPTPRAFFPRGAGGRAAPRGAANFRWEGGVGGERGPPARRGS